MEPTAQERWFDANIRHQIGLLRVSGGIRNEVWELLDATEADLRNAIRRRLRNVRGTNTPADVLRLQKLLDEIREIRNTAWRRVDAVLISELSALAASEPDFSDALLKTVVPVQIETTLPASALIRALVTSKPFEGRTLREWSRTMQAADLARIEGQIRIGVVQGEDVATVARRVVGSVSMRGIDGVTQMARRDAESIVRTAVNHYANQARREYFKANAELFSGELFLATLDSRTTPICRSYDGDVFKIGVGPIPPLHMRCRSLRTAILDRFALGTRPMKPVTEKMLLREFAEREGFELDKLDRDALPFGMKRRFDDFARKRTRELIGIVPARTTYQQFLNRQSAQFQDDVLGKTRGALFRRGGLTLKQFVDRTGSEIPLSDLAELHSREFRTAGFEPAEFLTR